MYQAELADCQSTIAAQEDELNTNYEAHSTSIQSLKCQHSAFKAESEGKLQAAQREKEEALAAVRAEEAGKRDELKREHEQLVQRLAGDHAKQVEGLEHAVAEGMKREEKLLSANQKAEAELRRELSTEKEASSAQFQVQLTALQEEARQKQANINSYQQRVASLEAELEQTRVLPVHQAVANDYGFTMDMHAQREQYLQGIIQAGQTREARLRLVGV